MISLLWPFHSFIMYGYGFLSRGFTNLREILHGGSATSRTGLLQFWGIAPRMAKLWASTGAIWWDMLLAEALVRATVKCSLSLICPVQFLFYMLMSLCFNESNDNDDNGKRSIDMVRKVRDFDWDWRVIILTIMPLTI